MSSGRCVAEPMSEPTKTSQADQATVAPVVPLANGPMMASYQARLASGELVPDRWQQEVVGLLDRLGQRLVTQREQWLGGKSGPMKWLTLIGLARPRRPEPLTGLYLWGGVGRGKTYLLDLFFDTLPFQEKLRLHFHRFMQIVHDELKALADLEDPLAPVAERMAARALVICLDELQVNDIADAMLLGRLFQHLFDRGVTLVVTSNQPPRDLYRDGLQRARFLPAIELLERHTRVVEFGGEIDYRLRLLEQLDVWLPLDAEDTEAKMAEHFARLRGINLHADRSDIVINHRRIPVKAWADGVVWFDFDQLCNTARGTGDYIEIATFFHTVMISGIPVMDASRDDVARRFVNMIDEFYDRNVDLIASAAAAPDSLYTGTRLAEAFERTASRLIEMQSREYFARRHREQPHD